MKHIHFYHQWKSWPNNFTAHYKILELFYKPRWWTVHIKRHHCVRQAKMVIIYYTILGSHFSFFSLTIIGNLWWNIFSPRTVCAKYQHKKHTNTKKRHEQLQRKRLESHQHWNFRSCTTHISKGIRKQHEKIKSIYRPRPSNVVQKRNGNYLWWKFEWGKTCTMLIQHAPNELNIFNSFAFGVVFFQHCFPFFTWCVFRVYISMFHFFLFPSASSSSRCRRYAIAIELKWSDETMKKPKCNRVVG